MSSAVLIILPFYWLLLSYLLTSKKLSPINSALLIVPCLFSLLPLLSAPPSLLVLWLSCGIYFLAIWVLKGKIEISLLGVLILLPHINNISKSSSVEMFLAIISVVYLLLLLGLKLAKEINLVWQMSIPILLNLLGYGVLYSGVFGRRGLSLEGLEGLYSLFEVEIVLFFFLLVGSILLKVLLLNSRAKIDLTALILLNFFYTLFIAQIMTESHIIGTDIQLTIPLWIIFSLLTFSFVDKESFGPVFIGLGLMLFWIWGSQEMGMGLTCLLFITTPYIFEDKEKKYLAFSVGAITLAALAIIPSFSDSWVANLGLLIIFAVLINELLKKIIGNLPRRGLYDRV